jgi:hypothetical protein
VTYTPSRVTSTYTSTLYTITNTKAQPTINKITSTVTASCHYPTRPSTPDPLWRIVPTIIPLPEGLPAPLDVVSTLLGDFLNPVSAKFRRGVNGNWEITNTKKFLHERTEKLKKLGNRAPDPQPLVVTDTETSDWVTSTSTYTGTTSTFTVYSKFPYLERDE